MQLDKPLTPEELDIIRRLQEGENPDANYDPYEPTVEWFTGKGKEEIMPLSAAPEPKRRWIPSKWEKQKVRATLTQCVRGPNIQHMCTAGYEDRPCHPPRPYPPQQAENRVQPAPILRHLE